MKKIPPMPVAFFILELSSEYLTTKLLKAKPRQKDAIRVNDMSGVIFILAEVMSL